MSRTNNLFKDTFNNILEHVITIGPHQQLPNTLQLAKRLNVSRTTIRAALDQLTNIGIITAIGKTQTVVRLPKKEDFYPQDETITSIERASEQLVEQVLKIATTGGVIREADMVKQLGETSYAVKNALRELERVGILSKEPNRHWVLNAPDRSTVEELLAVQELTESWAISQLKHRKLTALELQELEKLQLAHLKVLHQKSIDLEKFSELDIQFHQFLLGLGKNRFIMRLADSGPTMISFLFDLKSSPEIEFSTLLLEHLAVLSSIAAGREADAVELLKGHLSGSHRLLVEATLR